MQQWIESQWENKNPPWYLRVLSCGYHVIIHCRRFLYRKFLPSYRAKKPVIVIGNITVGGTGKTPLVIHLCQQFIKNGVTPLVVSRGYGGKSSTYPLLVDESTPATVCGDEPRLIASKTSCSVLVDPKRVRAVKWAEEHLTFDVIILDDGLQHLALQRDIECVVIDGQRGFSNEYLLPAGPLREPTSRLDHVDHIICNSGQCEFESINMSLKPSVFTSLKGQVLNVEAHPFSTVHAVAGIGHPKRFFDTLRQLGLTLIEHEFDDHHQFCRADLPWTDHPIIMTAKDAVKCFAFDLDNVWYLDVDAELSDNLAMTIATNLQLNCSFEEAK